MAQPAERITWAVETLAVAPDDHLLEIGCGHGVAVSLVCDKLDTGSITAIDRSAKMIAAATNRNRAYVAAGKAVFRHAPLDAADFGDKRFDTIFAIHVRSIWTNAAVEFPTIRRLLKPPGALYLFNQTPGWATVADTRPFTDRLTAILQSHAFAVTAVTHKPLHPSLAVSIRAEAV